MSDKMKSCPKCSGPENAFDEAEQYCGACGWCGVGGIAALRAEKVAKVNEIARELMAVTGEPMDQADNGKLYSAVELLVKIFDALKTKEGRTEAIGKLIVAFAVAEEMKNDPLTAEEGAKVKRIAELIGDAYDLLTN